jgi:hypothetical protein
MKHKEKLRNIERNMKTKKESKRHEKENKENLLGLANKESVPYLTPRASYRRVHLLLGCIVGQYY